MVCRKCTLTVGVDFFPQTEFVTVQIFGLLAVYESHAGVTLVAATVARQHVIVIAMG